MAKETEVKEEVKETKVIETIADAEKAGYVSLEKSEKAQKEDGKAVADIITVENRKMHKLA